MTKDQLLEQFQRFERGELSDDETAALHQWLNKLGPHPLGSDFMWNPDQAGLPLDASAEQLVDTIWSWAPRALVLEVARLEAATASKDTRLVIFDGAPVGCPTQAVVPVSAGIAVGERYAVALHGFRLADGTETRCQFIDRAYSNATILERSTLPVGADVSEQFGYRSGSG